MDKSLFNEKIRNETSSSIRIFKCNKCNRIPYIKFFNENNYTTKTNLTKIFIKCKCREFDTTNFDELNKFHSFIEISPQKKKKINSNSDLTEDMYEQIKNGFKKAKEKIDVKIKNIVEKEIEYINSKINRIKELYKNYFNKNKKILDIIQIIMNTYENYSLDNEKDLEILNQTILNNTSFDLELAEYYDDYLESYLKKNIINIGEKKYNILHLKSLKFEEILNYQSKIEVLSNNKLLLVCKPLSIKNNLIYFCVNPENNFKIEYKKIIDKYMVFNECFLLENEVLFLYKNNNKEIINRIYFLKINTGEIEEYISDYKYYINLNNGNILGYNKDKLSIINQKGISLKEYIDDSQYKISNGIMLSNKFIFLLKQNFKSKHTKLSLLDPDSLIESKSKISEYLNFRHYIEIKNFNKKILLINIDLLYIFNYDLCIESIINISIKLEKSIYINNYYISLTDMDSSFAFINSKTYKTEYFDIPYLINSDNKLVFHNFIYFKDEDAYHLLCFYQNKCFIFKGNEILIYKFPNPIKY